MLIVYCFSYIAIEKNVQACPQPLSENGSKLIKESACIYGSTPLHLAAEYGHLHIVKYFADEQGCNLSCLDGQNQTPLHRAAMKGHVDIVKFLTMEKHCDPMLKDCENDTPCTPPCSTGRPLASSIIFH